MAFWGKIYGQYCEARQMRQLLQGRTQQTNQGGSLPITVLEGNEKSCCVGAVKNLVRETKPVEREKEK